MRIIGAEATGAADYWYAKASSPIKTLQDTNGRTIAYSTNGSSTQSIVRAFIDEFKLTAKPMATGNPSVTLTAVMTDQVDVGWASPPFGLKEQEAGQSAWLQATDAALVRGQTIRVIVANAQALEKRKEAIGRFMQAYRETIDYMYSDNPQVIKDYAEFVKVPEATATPRARRILSQEPARTPTRLKGSTLLRQGSGQPEVHPRRHWTPQQLAGTHSDSAVEVASKFVTPGTCAGHPRFLSSVAE